LLLSRTGNDRFAGKVKSDNNVVNCLADNGARRDTTTAGGFRPPCNGTSTVVLLPCDAKGSTTNQIVIAQVPMQPVA
jgi:hypothetical protein